MSVTRLRARLLLVGLIILASDSGRTGVITDPARPPVLQTGPSDDSPHPVSQQAESPAPPKAPRTDRYGDPLPDGAIARLGTARWRLDAHGANAMTVAADGRTLLTANTTTGITIWDMETGKPIRRIPEKPELHKEWFGLGPSSVALTADGRKAIFIPADRVLNGTIFLVDVSTGKEIRTWRDPLGQKFTGVVSADGRILATRTGGRPRSIVVQIWSTDSGKLLRELPGTPKQMNPFYLKPPALSADGKTLAWTSEDGTGPIHVVDVATGEERHQLGDLGEDEGGE